MKGVNINWTSCLLAAISHESAPLRNSYQSQVRPAAHHLILEELREGEGEAIRSTRGSPIL